MKCDNDITKTIKKSAKIRNANLSRSFVRINLYNYEEENNRLIQTNILVYASLHNS